MRCAVKLGTIYSYDLMNVDYLTLDDPEGKNIYCNIHRKRMLGAALKKIEAAKKAIKSSVQKRKYSDFKKGQA